MLDVFQTTFGPGLMDFCGLVPSVAAKKDKKHALDSTVLLLAKITVQPPWRQMRPSFLRNEINCYFIIVVLLDTHKPIKVIVLMLVRFRLLLPGC